MCVGFCGFVLESLVTSVCAGTSYFVEAGSPAIPARVSLCLQALSIFTSLSDDIEVGSP